MIKEIPRVVEYYCDGCGKKVDEFEMKLSFSMVSRSFLGDAGPDVKREFDYCRECAWKTYKFLLPNE